MRKNVLITGIQGFVGANLALHELANGNHVVGIIRDVNHKHREDVLSKCSIVRGDIADANVVDHAVSYYEIDKVYHLAANSIVKVGVSDPVSNYKTNVMGTVHVLDAVRRISPQAKVVVASSDKSYGTQKKLPYTEDMKLIPECPYSTSKACTDMIAQSFAKTYDLDINVVRCSNIYGPGDMNTSRLIPKSILRILEGERPVIYSGVLNFKREFIYVDDVCRAYDLVAEQGARGEIYNIGIKEFVTIEQVVSKISQLMGSDGFEVIEKSFPEIPNQWMDGSKLMQLGWRHNFDLDEGMRRTIEWYKNRRMQDVGTRNWARSKVG